ncbi:nicotinate-nucleotide pyrophosphorylase [carboxylating] [Gracilibacillus ureilyticus]|uniref:Probable nicotinate-nucleotide pyrophosphorylase [carboxylating] n=1 Tax=Gracilibacillus ureilyticus TaxID=531814 RepID=A0A1H9RNL6_9BACI|nr:carboxylating nicotinate-nucleotide diphosphorylase [Gracilibacillus ureilyticus]SER74296.1 nicotinate-nucleotide pyrophosphorylase [carboxylating] [Gracilibacillus ureilyticus]
MNRWLFRKKLEAFFQEDIGDGDKTSEYLFENDQVIEGEFLAKEDGVFSGEKVLMEGYPLLDSDVHIHLLKRDGDIVQKGDTIAIVKGNNKAILSGERVILNLIQRMSGIATITSQVVQELNNPEIHVCDTRKTTPGLRMLEKYAVTCGGGKNHRHGLYDGIMIKDNHIKAAGSLTRAVEKVRKKAGHMIKVEVEVENESQLIEAIDSNVDVIMLDNQTPEQIRQWIDKIPDSITTEASGNITLQNIATYRETGVNYISLGFITHSAKALDISLRLMGEE